MPPSPRQKTTEGMGVACAPGFFLAYAPEHLLTPVDFGSLGAPATFAFAWDGGKLWTSLGK